MVLKVKCISSIYGLGVERLPDTCFSAIIDAYSLTGSRVSVMYHSVSHFSYETHIFGSSLVAND